MKRIAIYFGMTLTVGLGACNNNLSEKPFSNVSQNTYNYDDPYNAMGIVYANFRSLYDHVNWNIVQETTSDELVMPANASGWDDGGIYKRMHLHTWNSENPQFLNMWNNIYKGVGDANRVIKQLNDGIIKIPGGFTKENFVAEMRVARACYYWILLDSFGDVPLVTDPLDGLATPADYPGKTKRAEVYKFVVDEINAALPDLTESIDKTTYGRFNKWAAKTLLANVYLNAGVYTGTADWANCLAQCNDIIGHYTLEPKYKDIFKTNNESSIEIIWAIPFDENQAGGFRPHMYSWHGALRAKEDLQTTPWGSGSAMGVTQFINTYDATDQRLPDTWLIGKQNALDNGQPINGSDGKPLDFTKDIPDGLYTGESEGYRMNKFEVKVGAKTDLSNDFPFFRYAQVLMMKAECLLRAGDADGAAALVTQVRQRDFPGDPAKATVTGAQLKQNSAYQYGLVKNYKITDPGNQDVVPYGRFLDELGWEFAWESYRRRDMIRFGVFQKKSWLSHVSDADDRTIFPLPQQVVNANPKLQ